MASWSLPLALADGQWHGRLVLAATLLALYCGGCVVYNIWFHPLSSFPGPWLARSTLASPIRSHYRFYPGLTCGCSFGAFGIPREDGSIDPSKPSTANTVSAWIFKTAIGQRSHTYTQVPFSECPQMNSLLLPWSLGKPYTVIRHQANNVAPKAISTTYSLQATTRNASAASATRRRMRA